MPISLTLSMISSSPTRSDYPALCSPRRSSPDLTDPVPCPSHQGGQQGRGLVSWTVEKLLAGLCPSLLHSCNPLEANMYSRPKRNQGSIDSSFNRYLLGISCMPSPALASRDLKRSKTQKNPRSCQAYILPSPKQIPVSGRKLLRM